MRRPKRILRKLAISLVTLAALLLIAELGLRAAGYATSPASYFDSDIGYRFQPNQTRTMFGKDRVELATVVLNGLGLRGPEPAGTLEPGAKRIVCLGDSFTFGWAVGDEETFPAYLRARIAAELGPGSAEVLNFGTPGHNTENELAVYEKLVRPLEPDVVVLGFYLNDLEPPFATVPNTDTWLYSAFGRTALLEAFHKLLGPRTSLFRVDQTTERKAYVRAFTQNRMAIYRDPRGELGTPYLAACKDALGRLIEAVRADDARLLLVAFPGRFQVDPLRTARGEGKDEAQLESELCPVQREVETIARENEVPFLDLLGPFVDSAVHPYHPVDNGHPSPEGNALSAEAVFEALRGEGWL
ncbi:MAG: SGNH/GDSL hydrolase family protein [bacterium]|nr:SGNH/GDSL hydrolase family protein [bacterium]